MFGYIVVNPQSLSEDRQQRFRSVYCGLCKTLRARHGLPGGATLSYDMTFLALLLNALYEPDERVGEERCPVHPMKRHPFAVSPVMDYVADINVMLAYYKRRDDWNDDRSISAAAGAGMLKAAFRRASAGLPDKCEAIERWLAEIRRIESGGIEEIDPPANATGQMLGELFVCRADDPWADTLRAVGDGLGRFIYFMDAYDDLPADLRKKRYNPLKPLREREDYEDLCQSALMMMAADATQAFEQLPIVLDADILRNVLYSGVWSRYVRIQNKREARRKGAE